MAENHHNRPQKKRPPERMERALRLRGWIIAAAAVLLAFGYLSYRLFQIQIVDGDYYRQLASAQQLKDSVIEAERGNIYDATGKLLASSSIVWDISCDPKGSRGLYTTLEQTEQEKAEGKEPVRILDETICAEVSAGIARILTANDGSDGAAVDTAGAPYQEMYAKVYKAFSSINRQYRSLAEKVDLPVSEAVRAFINDYNKRDEEKGKNIAIVISITKTYKRNYPYGAFAGAVIGFCNADGVGTYGLERSYEATLAGVDGRSISVKDANGQVIDADNATEYKAQDGYNVHSTLDANVQEVVERYLTEAIKAHNVAHRGCAIVMDVNTGAVLAMATKPDFDPNDPNYVYDLEYMQALVKAEPELYQVYEKDENGKDKLDALGNKIPDADYDYTGIYREIQRKNKAVTELYYPGSVFKTIVAAAALDSGKATDRTAYRCSGAYNVADRTYHCANRKAHGAMDMWGGLRHSCNLFFIQTAEHIGTSTFYDYFKAFGFTETTGVDLPYETSYMQYYPQEKLGPVELASSSFGQSMKITPLQMCTAMAACVNGGYLVQPHLVSEITDDAGNTVEKTQTQVKRQVLSESTSARLCDMLEYEVGDGKNTDGGYRAYVAGYRVGGKSGTSEQLDMDKRVSDGDYKKVASFCAVFPANDPEYLVYIMLDDPNNASTDYSSVLAAPVVGNIISEIGPYLGVATSGLDTSATVKVPDLTGQEWGDAQVELNRKGLKHRLVTGENDATAARVTYQYPKAKTEVSAGTTVYLYVAGTQPTSVTVPQVTGHTVEFAQQMLSAAGLNYLIKGSGTVQSQSLAHGTSVEMGTVITLECG